MDDRLGHRWILPILATVILVAFALVWTAAPEDLRGVLLLAGGVGCVVVYWGLYAIQRRRHW